MRNENKKPAFIISVIAATAFLIYLLKNEPGIPSVELIGLCLTILWIMFNMLTYRGKYFPRIVYALKIGYPLFIFILVMAALGRL